MIRRHSSLTFSMLEQIITRARIMKTQIKSEEWAVNRAMFIFPTVHYTWMYPIYGKFFDIAINIITWNWK